MTDTTNSNVDIWDDSLCSVEDEYSSHASSKTLNETCQFKNSLVSNKGDASTARKLSQDEVWLSKSKFWVNKYKARANSYIEKSADNSITFAEGRKMRKQTQTFHIQASLEMAKNIRSEIQQRKWKKICDEKEMDSSKILSIIGGSNGEI